MFKNPSFPFGIDPVHLPFLSFFLTSSSSNPSLPSTTPSKQHSNNLTFHVSCPTTTQQSSLKHYFVNFERIHLRQLSATFRNVNSDSP